MMSIDQKTLANVLHRAITLLLLMRNDFHCNPSHFFYSLVLSAAPRPRLRRSSPGRRSRPASATSAPRISGRRSRRRNTLWSCSTRHVRTCNHSYLTPVPVCFINRAVAVQKHTHARKSLCNPLQSGPFYCRSVNAILAPVLTGRHTQLRAASEAAHSQFINTNDVMGGCCTIQNLFNLRFFQKLFSAE